MTITTPTETVLPRLRQELVILPAPFAENGAPQWMLHDPVRNAFHLLGETAVKLLSYWDAVPPATVLDTAKRDNPDTEITSEHLSEMAEFILAQKLAVDPPGGDPESFARQEAASHPPLHEYIIHKYLYFRIPLFRPKAFLDKYASRFEIAFAPLTWKIIAMLGVIGLYFTSRQWDIFTTTFWYFFSLEGFLFYALSLVIIKALHELGHAFTAHHFGAKVPIIGVAFLVMFPVLYTDTTDAWRLTSRRQRLLIDSAGMIVELGIASLSLFLWSFLPDGPLRSAAFFAATTSWTLSLLVNLNPCMRFDGYYLLGDFFKVRNLQKQGFEMGRWVMRETLFALGAAKPFPATPRQVFGLCTYAYVTWIYRFFLFIGIAILVHHIFPKAIGIILFTIEILWFICLPMWREIKKWWSLRMTILSRPRGRLTLGLWALALLIFFYPWQDTVRAPALIQPVHHTELFPPAAADIDAVYVTSGETVKTGQVLMRLTAPTLTHDLAQSEKRMALLQAQIARRSARLEDRRSGVTLDDQLRREEERAAGLRDLIGEMTLKAPHAGLVKSLPPTLHVGRSVTSTDRLMRIITPTEFELVAYPAENTATRITSGAALTFVSDDPLLPVYHGVTQTLSPTAQSIILDKELTSLYGGDLAVEENPEGALVPVRPVFKLRGTLPEGDTKLTRLHRGVVHVAATPESPASALYRRVVGILIRETDF